MSSEEQQQEIPFPPTGMAFRWGPSVDKRAVVLQVIAAGGATSYTMALSLADVAVFQKGLSDAAAACESQIEVPRLIVPGRGA